MEKKKSKGWSLRLNAKLVLMVVCPVLALLLASILTLTRQKKTLQAEINGTVRTQAFREASQIVKSTLMLCAESEARNQRELTYTIGVAQKLITQAGGLRLGDQPADWRAINQFSKETQTLSLPRFVLGNSPLPQTDDLKTPAPIVDDIRQLTGNFCTIFQRINPAGDMLRVTTSVQTLDGKRATGTFIPVKQPDGIANPVLEKILRGETYRGRAYVVNDWHATVYVPLWDEAKTNIIGMLYVGVGLGQITQELRAAIMKQQVGKTGYVFILGGKGAERGRYVLSEGGKRDGESIWDAKDASGRLFVQALVQSALAQKNGDVAYETYPWKNEADSAPRTKFAAVTYFPSWDWVIGAGAYEDDFADLSQTLGQSLDHMLRRVMIIAGAVTLLALLLGLYFSKNISASLNAAITNLSLGSQQITSAADQVANSSQSLAQSSSEQASSLEHTSSSLEEMSAMTRNNAESASRSKTLAADARRVAEDGAHDIERMHAAMEEIKKSSDQIANIIKTIDAIAFQTNLLALNAAVEAARAGEAGAGFAVVAEEVRALAHRTTQAARDTAAMIEEAIHKTEQGVQISAKVAGNLGEIVEKVRLVDGLIAEVANASAEQSSGLGQMTESVGKMDAVVQANAASSEESAAASQELNAQAHALLDVVASLEKLVGVKHRELTDEINAAEAEVARPQGRKSPKTPRKKLALEVAGSTR